MTGVVLLIACANIANLLLARGANRATEMGVRLALGASRRQLLTQLLTESVLLALMGGVASLLVARWTLGLIATLLPPDASSSLVFELQPSVLLFAALMSIGTGLLFGIFPALHSTRSDLVGAIRSNAGAVSGARGAARFRATLVTAQIALATTLLISAGLFLKSLVNVTHVELGVRVDDVVTFGISPERSGYDSTRFRLLYQRVEGELAALPGVTGVTSSRVPLLGGSNWGTDVYVQGFAHGPDVDNNSRFNEVGAGYFGMLGIPILSGREFTPSDRDGSGNVAIVNETFAKKFHLGTDAVGKFMSSEQPDSLDIQIVGVAKDAKYSEVKDEIPPLFFMPWQQDANVGTMNFYIRTALAPQLLRRDPGPDEADRSGSAGGEPQDHAPADPGERLSRPDDQPAVGRLCRAGHPARRRRALRRPGLHRGAAHPGDRRPHGAGRRRPAGAPDGDAAGAHHDGQSAR